MPILGLSVGGFDPNNSAVSYIVFVRSGKDKEKIKSSSIIKSKFSEHTYQKRETCVMVFLQQKLIEL